MKPSPHTVLLVRHGETEWTISGQHTSRTDLELTARGREQARAQGHQLASRSFAAVWVSPMRRASETCTLAGLSDVAVVDPDLSEWDYGDDEGRTTLEIRIERAGWSVWRDGPRGGETIADVVRRADRVISRLSTPLAHGDVALFSHGHFLRLLAARWLGLPGDGGRLFALTPASLSMLGFEREQPVLRLWNATTEPAQ